MGGGIGGGLAFVLGGLGGFFLALLFVHLVFLHRRLLSVVCSEAKNRRTRHLGVLSGLDWLFQGFLRMFGQNVWG